MSWLGTAVAARTEAGQALMQSQGVSDLTTLYGQAVALRMRTFGGLGTLILLVALPVGFMLPMTRRPDPPNSPAPLEADVPQESPHRSHLFTLLLALVAALLVLGPEFVYLRDQFGTRINTVFKFYYQAWILWSLAAAFGSALLFRNLRGAWRWTYAAGFAVLMIGALTYPVLGAINKANGFKPVDGFTLDALRPLAKYNPDEAAAAEWLRDAPPGVIVEAADPGSSYREYGRLSEYSGLPTVLGWVGHERQWRGGSTEMGSRMDDIARLYVTNDWEVAKAIIEQYDIRYVVVGNLERSKYPLNEGKFSERLPVVFRQGNLVIYEASQ